LPYTNPKIEKGGFCPKGAPGSVFVCTTTYMSHTCVYINI
jgi:hypothetical protein